MGEAAAARESALRDEVEALLPAAPVRDEWPFVSMVVPTHNGLPLLERLAAGLVSCTDYQRLELVVVDNASTDGTVDWLEREEMPFAVTVVANAQNESFSVACNRGAAAASGELLLF
ncbi:MAG TPA: glycosyltransferase, partial [Solirubrobacteraceae bacterium]|nr:glycosyltransferase [Solirubrobacteraceae bacterium]